MRSMLLSHFRLFLGFGDSSMTPLCANKHLFEESFIRSGEMEVNGIPATSSCGPFFLENVSID